MGRPDDARRYARANIVAWERLIADGGLDTIVVNASGCGTTVKTYADLFADDPEWAARAARVGALARDISEVAASFPLKLRDDPPRVRITYHNPCSLENGQGIASGPVRLLRQAGFDLVAAPPSPACCGSAGTYNMLQPEIARQLGERKAAALESVGPALIATANIGCQVQISAYTDVPVVHTVELLDWATGGPPPSEMLTRAAA
jgi:glycolate oxidase iron-sulfur subunit